VVDPIVFLDIATIKGFVTLMHLHSLGMKFNYIHLHCMANVA